MLITKCYRHPYCENEQPNPVGYNKAIRRIALLTSDEPATLTCQLTSTWNDAQANKKELYIKTARKACINVCYQPPMSDEPVALMSAYQLAINRNRKLQILSIHAHRYPAETL